MLKNEELHWLATAFAISVFPFPFCQILSNDHHGSRTGGPNNRIPRAGALRPENKSGLRDGSTTASCNVCFASERPAIQCG